MQAFRRAALRAVSLHPARSIGVPQQRFALLVSSRAGSQPLYRSFHDARRSFAPLSNEQPTEEKAVDEAQATSAEPSAPEIIEQRGSADAEAPIVSPDVTDGAQRQDGPGVIERAQEATGNTARAARQAGNQAQVFEGDSKIEHTLYVGNLVWQTTTEELADEFSRYGEIRNVRIVSDNRGISRGFGYVEFASRNDAQNAAVEHNQRDFKGRRIMVQFHKPRPQSLSSGTPNARRVMASSPKAPTSTLFIGNMSYQMSDRDLNDLFRDIRDVIDIRVAIDRQTGQPRGFAHADFVDVASAQRAKEQLTGKMIYGRELRLDYSEAVNNRSSPRSAQVAEPANESV